MMATEKRLIDANDLRTQFDDIPPYIGLAGSLVQQYIDKAPTVDAVEAAHGRWEPCGNCGYRCSKCDFWVAFRSLNNYCPNCGAKMDGDGNG